MHTQISHIRTNITFYDAMGNPTSYLGKTMEWEGKQLSSVYFGNNTISYAYDENGLRTQKTVNGTITNYHYNGSVLIGMTNSGNRSDSFRFSYDSNGNVVSISWDMPRTYNPSGTAYYLRNAQGDIVGLLDEQGNKVIDYMYDSWGKDISPLPRDQAYIDLQHFQPFRYRGYVYDSETGWYYLQSRYYDPATGRFLSADVLLSTGQGVLGHNSYAYCLNNPVNMSDEGGNACADNNGSDIPPWLMVLICPFVLLAGCSQTEYTDPPDDFIICEDPDVTCLGYVLGYVHEAIGWQQSSRNKELRWSYGAYGYSLIGVSGKLINHINEDFGCVVAREVSNPSEVNEGEILVAVVLSRKENMLSGADDYHYAFRLKNGTWADKRGSHNARFGAVNPEVGDWAGEYKGPTAFIAISINYYVY